MCLLAQLLKKRLYLSLAAVAASGLLVAITLWWNSQLSGMIHIISQGKALSPEIIAWAVITMLLMCAANAIKTYIAGYTCEALSHDLRMGYARYFSSLPITEIERLNAGEQLSKLQNEIADVSGYLSGNFFQIVHDLITFVSTFIWLSMINAKLTLSVNLPVFIIVIYVFYSSRIISNSAQRSQQAKGRMNKFADTLLTLFPIVRLYDAAEMLLENYNTEVTEWEKQTVKVERLRARLMSLSGLLSNIPLMLLFLIGGSMVIEGALALGTLYIFLNLSGNVSGIMMNMPGFIASFRQFLANTNRISTKIIFTGKGQPL